MDNNFLIGAASAAFQDAQDLNIKSDWVKLIKDSQKEKEYIDSKFASKLNEKPERYIKALKDLGFNTFRFSIDWAWIEPIEGEINEEALVWYDNFFKTLKENEIEPVVTLVHFTHPQWFIEKGGWEKEANIEYSINFVSLVVNRYKDYVKYWITINEPSVYSNFSYIQKQRPPFKRNLILALIVQIVLSKAHKKMYQKIHEIYDSEVFVAVSNAIWPLIDFKTKKRKFYLEPFNFLINYIPFKIAYPYFDFIGLNYYGVFLMDAKALLNILLKKNGSEEEIKRAKIHKNSFGWWIYPDGLKDTLDSLSKYNKPILITETGTYDEDESMAEKYLIEHTKILQEYKQKSNSKTNLIGIIYWCLVDDFEWDYGYKPRFGLMQLNKENPESNFNLKNRAIVLKKFIDQNLRNNKS